VTKFSKRKGNIAKHILVIMPKSNEPISDNYTTTKYTYLLSAYQNHINFQLIFSSFFEKQQEQLVWKLEDLNKGYEEQRYT
jgi:dihydroorotase